MINFSAFASYCIDVYYSFLLLNLFMCFSWQSPLVSESLTFKLYLRCLQHYQNILLGTTVLKQDLNNRKHVLIFNHFHPDISFLNLVSYVMNVGKKNTALLLHATLDHFHQMCLTQCFQDSVTWHKFLSYTHLLIAFCKFLGLPTKYMYTITFYLFPTYNLNTLYLLTVTSIMCYLIILHQ